MNRRVLLPLAALLLSSAGVAAESPGLTAQSQAPVTLAMPKSVRDGAQKLLADWLTAANSESIDGLAWRTIAFAGLVPDVDVLMDTHRMNASQALMISGLSLLENKTLGEDAHAVRNIAYALDLIASGRTVQPTRHNLISRF